MNEIEKKIIELIDNIRPYLISDGGNIEFVEYKDNIVYIKMQGACANCGMLDITLKDGIESMLKDEIPEIKEVINVG
ncbi:MAG: NifU family protein [Bacilli bacterium]|nr:NifU family protein [Bacilli bacterium]